MTVENPLWGAPRIHGELLMVKTSAGDLVLDSLRDDVRMWMETDYRFVKRQSQTNQNVWVAIGVPTPPPPFVSQEALRVSFFNSPRPPSAALTHWRRLGVARLRRSQPSTSPVRSQ
jgi:Bacterial transglutaminase-like cysteine proteinase BTLCP